MTNDELIMYAFLNDCPRLVKAVQDNVLILIDKDDNKLTYMLKYEYLPTEQDYLDFLFDMDMTNIVYQMQLLHNEYFLRIYI
jgi:hypothetical protein